MSKAMARSGGAFLVETLDPAIQRFARSVGFDEKIGGTIHLAVGSSYMFNGGKNVSAVHWDIVTDLFAAAGEAVRGQWARPGERSVVLSG